MTRRSNPLRRSECEEDSAYTLVGFMEAQRADLRAHYPVDGNAACGHSTKAVTVAISVGWNTSTLNAELLLKLGKLLP